MRLVFASVPDVDHSRGCSTQVHNVIRMGDELSTKPTEGGVKSSKDRENQILEASECSSHPGFRTSLD